jgi:hypothetical protein
VPLDRIEPSCRLEPCVHDVVRAASHRHQGMKASAVAQRRAVQHDILRLEAVQVGGPGNSEKGQVDVGEHSPFGRPVVRPR